MDSEEYLLHQELRDHEEDIRVVRWCPLGLLVGSRDKTASLWVFDDKADRWVSQTAFIGHADFVTALAWAPATPTASAAVITGSRDATVRLWDPEVGEETSRGSGHRYQVTDLAVAGHGAANVFSASLDGTIRVWARGDLAPLVTLTGHAGPVQALAWVPLGTAVGEGGDGQFLLASGSGDCTIRLWDSDKAAEAGGDAALLSVQAHADTVRSLCAAPGLGLLVSAGHDGSVKGWRVERDGALRLRQAFSAPAHDSLVFAVASAGDSGRLATASEDGTTKILEVGTTGTAGTAGGQQLSVATKQTLDHGRTVWSVAFAPGSGDLATGAADGVARVFSDVRGASFARRLRAARTRAAALSGPSSSSGPAPGPAADPVALARAAHDRWTSAVVAARAAAGGGSGGATGASGAPRPEAPGPSGSASGTPQTTSDAELQRLLPAGLKLSNPSVLERPGTKPGQTVVTRKGNGAAAYQWDADVRKWEFVGDLVSGPAAPAGATGPPPAAEGRPSYDHEFSVDIADDRPPLALRMNRGDDAHEVADAFLLEHGLPSSYREQVAQFVVTNGGAIVGKNLGASAFSGDPLTGAGAYVPPAPAAPAAGRGGGGAPAVPPRPSAEHIPAKLPLAFDGVPPRAAAAAKLRGLAATLGPTAAPGPPALEALLDASCGPVSDSVPAAPAALAALATMLSSLGPSDLAVPLDLARRLSLSRATSARISTDPALEAAVRRAASLGGGAGASPEAAPPPAPVRTAALRLAANLAASQPTRGLARALAEPLLEAAESAGLGGWDAQPRATRAAAAALALNLAATLRDAGPALDSIAAAVALYAGRIAAGTPSDEGETRRRALAAAGTAALASPAAKAAAKDLLAAVAAGMSGETGVVADARNEMVAVLT